MIKWYNFYVTDVKKLLGWFSNIEEVFVVGNFFSLILALEYIEQHLCEEIDMSKLSDNAFISLSGLQKQFRKVFNYSIKEYISKRRMSVAAKELIETKTTIIQIALKYGYNSPEVFMRTFKKMYGETPSEYRKQKRYVNMFPKIQVDEIDTETYAFYKDISVLYDFMIKNESIYVVCFDVVGLMQINEISREAGDIVLLETVHRIETAKKTDMQLIRLGGDEFAVLVSNADIEYCRELEKAVLSQNGKHITYNGKKYRIELRSWVGKLPKTETLRDLSATLIKNVKYQLD